MCIFIYYGAQNKGKMFRSVSDGFGKAIGNHADTLTKLDQLLRSSLEYSPGKGSQPWQSTFQPTQIPVLCVTTTLSGGEFHAGGGATNDATHRKQLFYDPTSSPKIVFFDPVLTATTPERVWLSTGVRTIDHCVEAICSINASPESDAVAEKGLREPIPALLRCKADPQGLPARLSCQLGWLESTKSLALRTALEAIMVSDSSLGLSAFPLARLAASRCRRS